MSSQPSNPLVSVVIATHNYARFLGKAVQSVQAQTCADWECLIIDDASTDETPELAATLMREDGRLRYLRNERNLGRSQSRNRGCEEARGKYVAFLDADDCWEPDKLKGQLEALGRAPAAVLCFTDVIVVSADATSMFSCPKHWVRNLEAGLRVDNCINQSSVLALRTVILALGGYDRAAETAEDWDLWIRLLQARGAGAFVHLDRPVTNYRLHGSNSIGNWAVMNRGERVVVRRILLRRFWALRHPLLAWRVMDGQLEREAKRYEQAGLRSRAFFCTWAWACFAPWKRWRWRQTAKMLAIPHRGAALGS